MKKLSEKEVIGILGSTRCIQKDELSLSYTEYLIRELKKHGVSFWRANK